MPAEGLSGRSRHPLDSQEISFDIYAAGQRPVCAGCAGEETFLAHYIDGTG